MNINEINVLVLAYLGDSVYENYIRKHLINKNISNVDKLQKESIKYVSAKAQAIFITNMIENNKLTEEELSVYKRARNNNSSKHPKNTDVVTYKKATGFEAVIGYLELLDNNRRINEIINYILNEV